MPFYKKRKTETDRLKEAVWFVRVTEEDYAYFLENLARIEDKDNDYLYLRDIKDFALFNVANDISPNFVEFFWTTAVDRLLRALIVYFQYYLQVWDAIKYRCQRKHLIRHPNTLVREEKWRNNLNNLRYIVSREYCALIEGMYDSSHFHHMGPKRNQNSKSRLDYLIYALLFRYAIRVIGVGLGKIGNQIIQDEMARMFIPGKNIFRIEGLRDNFSIFDKQCLEDPFKYPTLQAGAPVLHELFRYNRDPHLKTLGHSVDLPVDSDDKEINLLHMIYLCPEPFLRFCNIKLGILGQSRDTLKSLIKMTDKHRGDVLHISTNEKLQVPPSTVDEKVVPCMFEDLPQICDLPLSNTNLYTYDKRKIILNWKKYLKLDDRYSMCKFVTNTSSSIISDSSSSLSPTTS